jgi:hypothetical protein
VRIMMVDPLVCDPSDPRDDCSIVYLRMPFGGVVLWTHAA